MGDEVTAVLFKQKFLDGIQQGMITLAFRRWRRPTVKAGGTLLTAAGQLQILSVEPISETQLNDYDAVLAGFEDLEGLLVDLRSQRAELLYRIQFELSGPDPRIALRDNVELTPDELQSLQAKLDRLDQRATGGAWTKSILELIQHNPEMSAGQLAELSDRDKEWLKENIRKLKNLGLTESLNPGYRLSPRGREFLGLS